MSETKAPPPSHPALQIDDARVTLKLELLERAMPARSAAVFGDMYIVEGAYTLRCLELGCERVVLVDSLETPGFQRTRLEHPRLDFYKGDFASGPFMASIQEQFDVTVVYDILLHQAPLLHTIHLMLEKTAQRICICQPVLKERDTPNMLVYLPGNTNRELYPLAEPSGEYKAFDAQAVNQSNWIWGMTPSLLRSVLAGEGFEVTEAHDGPDMPNPAWMWWGCIAERRAGNPAHWSRMRPYAGLYEPGWQAAP
jgi:hypothetical protein